MDGLLSESQFIAFLAAVINIGERVSRKMDYTPEAAVKRARELYAESIRQNDPDALLKSAARRAAEPTK